MSLVYRKKYERLSRNKLFTIPIRTNVKDHVKNHVLMYFSIGKFVSETIVRYAIYLAKIYTYPLRYLHTYKENAFIRYTYNKKKT